MTCSIRAETYRKLPKALFNDIWCIYKKFKASDVLICYGRRQSKYLYNH